MNNRIWRAKRVLALLALLFMLFGTGWMTTDIFAQLKKPVIKGPIIKPI